MMVPLETPASRRVNCAGFPVFAEIIEERVGDVAAVDRRDNHVLQPKAGAGRVQDAHEDLMPLGRAPPQYWDTELARGW